MGDHPNATLVRELLEAFDNGDADKIRASMAEDVKWHMIGGKSVQGLEQLAGYLNDSAAEYTINGDVHDIVGNDEHVIALVNATARAGDDVFDYRTAEIMHVENGKVTERWAFSDDTAAINEFFSRFE